MEGNSSVGMKENVAGLLSYLATWVTGLIFFILEKQSSFVKFHAAQSLVTFATLSITGLALSILSGIFKDVIGLGTIFWLLKGANTIAILIFWLAGMITSIQGKTVKFPFFGNIAETLVSKNP